MKKIKKGKLNFRDYKCFAIQYYENSERESYLKCMKQFLELKTYFGNEITEDDFVFAFAIRKTEKLFGEGSVFDLHDMTEKEIPRFYEDFIVLDYMSNIPIVDFKEKLKF